MPTMSWSKLILVAIWRPKWSSRPPNVCISAANANQILSVSRKSRRAEVKRCGLNQLASYMKKGRVLHRHGLDQLEGEMMAFSREWDRAVDGSPNRLDAMIWGITRLSKII